jgi:hypothetical protein
MGGAALGNLYDRRPAFCWPAMVCVLAFCPYGCHRQPPSAKHATGLAEATKQAEPTAASEGPVKRNCGALELEFLDSLVTPENVFADVGARQMYTHEVSSSENGQRNSAFFLKPQPDMVGDRHFHILAFGFACPGAFVGDGVPEPVVSSTAGPNGGFIGLSARTHDGAYDVRVSEGTLLPATVQPPPFSLEEALKSLLVRYDRARTAGVGRPLPYLRQDGRR